LAIACGSKLKAQETSETHQFGRSRSSTQKPKNFSVIYARHTRIKRKKNRSKRAKSPRTLPSKTHKLREPAVNLINPTKTTEESLRATGPVAKLRNREIEAKPPKGKKKFPEIGPARISRSKIRNNG
jgi:hypothetical protein